MGRLLATGDIHGHAAALHALIEAIAPQRDDTWVFLGDYIDRGPESRQVIDAVIALRKKCKVVTIRGNHEQMLIEAYDDLQKGDAYQYDFWLEVGGQETVASYDGSLDNVPKEHWKFYRELLWYHETDDFLFAHANYEYDRPLHEMDESILIWEHLHERKIPPPHVSGKTVVVGHTPQVNGCILHEGHLICIDTCCFGGGYLTTMDVQTEKLWQVDSDGVLAK
jgi:serine/threonine protein phosphatase 1